MNSEDDTSGKPQYGADLGQRTRPVTERLAQQSQSDRVGGKVGTVPRHLLVSSPAHSQNAAALAWYQKNVSAAGFSRPLRAAPAESGCEAGAASRASFPAREGGEAGRRGAGRSSGASGSLIPGLSLGALSRSRSRAPPAVDWSDRGAGARADV